jgi:effector-binding domain-containing protein
MSGTVVVREREAALVVTKRTAVTLREIGEVLGAAFAEVYAGIGSTAPDGAPFVIYHGMPEGDRPLEIQVCAPVRRAVDAPAGWSVEELSAGTFASLVHVGPYTSIGSAYEDLARWIPEHGMTMAGPPREVYLSEPDTPPERIQTVVEFPVERIPATAGR